MPTKPKVISLEEFTEKLADLLPKEGDDPEIMRLVHTPIVEDLGANKQWLRDIWVTVEELDAGDGDPEHTAVILAMFAALIIRAAYRTAYGEVAAEPVPKPAYVN